MNTNLDQDRRRWPGSGSLVTTDTVPFGYYLNEVGCTPSESEFENDCSSSAEWAAVRLGYPIIDIELIDVNFYACFEQSVLEYNRQINEFNIANNLVDLIGLDKTEFTNLTGVEVIGSGLPFAVEISKMYGTEALLGGKVELYRGYVDVKGSEKTARFEDIDERGLGGSQVYDLNAILLEQNPKLEGTRAEIRRVFHQRPAAISRIYDPFSMTGMSYSNILSEMGFAGYSPATQFLMTPIFEDLERVQAIEFNDMVRKSHYSFEITGDNKLRLFPVPTHDFRVWIEYYIESEKNAGGVLSDPNNPYSHVTDPSDVPYNLCKYCKINHAGKQWIRKYFLALCKETLGMIRQKYLTTPIPGGEVTLDGAELRSEAQKEMDDLIQQLKDLLEKTLKVNQLENKSKEADAVYNLLNKVPLKIYIG